MSRLSLFLVPILTLLCGSLLPLTAKAQSPRGVFTNPIDPNGADPFLLYDHGTYYLLCTDGPRDSFAPDGPHTITVRAARSLGSLSKATPKTVYTVTNDPKSSSKNNQFYESPELWHFGAHWYIYYTEYPNTVRVIESDTDDPQGAYHDKATLTNNTYDASVLVMPTGGLYLLGSTYGALVIQPLSNPYTLGGPQTVIARRDQSWEHTVIEAPDAVWHDGRLTLLYAAGGYNKDDYGVGGLKFTGTDPTQAASWTKLPGPLFRGLPSAHVWCAGVASPFASPDGTQTWFVYSDYNGYDYVKDVGTGPRTIMAQPMTWEPDGTLNLGVPLPPGQSLPLPSGEAVARRGR